MQAVAGSTDKSDALVTVKRIKGNLKIVLSSPLSSFFSEHHDLLVRKTLRDLEEEQIFITVEDNQALDFVLKARIKAAVSALQKREGKG